MRKRAITNLAGSCNTFKYYCKYNLLVSYNFILKTVLQTLTYEEHLLTIFQNSIYCKYIYSSVFINVFIKSNS